MDYNLDQQLFTNHQKLRSSNGAPVRRPVAVDPDCSYRENMGHIVNDAEKCAAAFCTIFRWKCCSATG